VFNTIENFKFYEEQDLKVIKTEKEFNLEDQANVDMIGIEERNKLNIFILNYL